jgi:hypothetical protein
MKPPAPPLRALASRVVILAYREDTGQLERCLRDQGLEPVVQRASYTPQELTYSRTIRCLLNHLAVWRDAAQAPGCTLVMEADFVPCRGFADLPAPFDPARHGPLAWAYLYAGGPRILRVEPGPFIGGHSACTVAMLISPQVAPLMVAFAEKLMAPPADLSAYSMWDTNLQWHVMGGGGRCYLPLRHYGEHGGEANPEHYAKKPGLVARLGISQNHHAECLMGRLAFLPPYAHGRLSRYLRKRALAKLVGFGRLCTGRVVPAKDGLSAGQVVRAYWIGLRRLLSVHWPP